MRQAIKTTDVYAFSELSDKAKERARDNYRENGFSYDWWDGVYGMAETAAGLLGIEIHRKGKHSPEIYFSGFYHQCSGASFVGSYRYKKGAAKAVKAEFPEDAQLYRIARELQGAQRRAFYRATAGISTGRGYGGDTRISVNVECEALNYSDYFPVIERDIKDALESFNAWIYSALEREYEYLTSDEAIDESILANEYEFTEAGEIY